ncbi:MAG: ATP-binding cassette domain-containing protein [Planctomycetota bacterium]
MRDLWMTFPGKTGGEPVHVLERVDLDVQKGEFVCIVGPSGCGKSTLLNIVAGFLPPTRGEVLVDDKPVTGPDPRRIFVFQENGVFPWLTVEQNIGFGLSRRSREQRHQLIAHYIDMVGLKGFEKAYPRELSGGMRQRVEIARALAPGPDIIWMDEPFGALDFLTRLKMRADLIRIWREEKKTVLFVTHDIDEAVQLADRVVVMTKRPATVQESVPVDLGRPRDLDSPGYLATRDRIFTAMGMSVKIGDDARSGAAASAPAAAPANPGDRREAEVVIVGGGPAGAILGAYLARAGVRTTIVDKSVHPRRHVGESLICSTTRVFQEIGALAAIENGGFVRKHGAVWTRWPQRVSRALQFRPMPHLGIGIDYTWHVDRSRLDQLLLDHAATVGVSVRQGQRAARVEFNGEQATGVRLADDTLVPARIVVDASGRNTLLGSQLGIKHNDPQFDQFTVHTWFEGFDRGPAATADHIHVHVLPRARSWLWQIPVGPGLTSVGIVTRRADFAHADEPTDAWFSRQLADQPELAARIAKAKPVQPFVRESNYSYSLDRVAGDGWLAIGDAGCFIDPLFSSGVSVAAESARAAANAIGVALRSGDVSARAFAAWEQDVKEGVQRWRDFVLSFYRLPAQFLDLLDGGTGTELLRPLLQGEVNAPAAATALAHLRAGIDQAAANPSHRWHRELVAI